MARNWLSGSSDFVLGALFGVFLLPVATYVWRWFSMNVGWSAFLQNAVLFVLAMAVLFIFLFFKRKEIKRQEIFEKAILSKLGIGLDAEVSKTKQVKKHK